MKKKYLKAIKALVARLPVTYQVLSHTTYCKGKALEADHVKALLPHQLDLIEEEVIYPLSGKIIIKVQHYRRIKRAYARSGDQGIIDYIQWVDRTNKYMATKYTDLNIEQVDQDIINVLKKGAKSFWYNLIAFLFAFISYMGKGKTK